jgi:uncharacterized repeat protein (TIGR01451 family)
MASKQPLILSLIIVISSFCITAEANTLEESTSPYVTSAEIQMTQQAGQDSNIITFSEFPVGTYITDQYSNRGIIFGGDSPFISTDRSNPTSPVLSGTPLFQGAIEGRFVNPKDGITPITVSAFSLDVGYFDTNGTTRIEWFDLNGNKLGEQTNSVIGIEHFNIEGYNIARWRVAIITSEPAGFAIDNLKIDFGSLDFNKVDDVDDGNCVGPGDEITYTISFGNPVTDPCDPDYLGTLTDVNIIDYLPEDLVFSSASGPNSVYHPSTHIVTWNIGTLEPNEPGSVTLTVKVNECISACGTITNLCKIKGGDWARGACENTPVLCASCPRPTCGELSDFLCTGDPNLNLTWCPGRFAADVNGHEVYFGSNFLIFDDFLQI